MPLAVLPSSALPLDVAMAKPFCLRGDLLREDSVEEEEGNLMVAAMVVISRMCVDWTRWMELSESHLIVSLRPKAQSRRKTEER